MEIKSTLYKIRYYLYIYLLLIIQLSFVNNGLLFSLYPNLLLLYVAFASQKFPKKTAFSIALIAGLFYDVLLSTSFGIRALVFFIIAIVINEISQYIFAENLRTSILYTLVSIFLYNVLLYIIYYFLSYKVYFRDIISNIFSIETLVSILIFYLMTCYIFVEKEKRPKKNKDKKEIFSKLKLRKGNLSEKNSN